MGPILLSALALAASAQDFVGPEGRGRLSDLGTQAQTLGRGAPAPEECRQLGAVGCFLAPKGAAGKEPSLLVYFRGFWEGHGNGRVPEKERLASSRQAVSFYGLEAAAAQAGAVLLVTGSSDVAVSESDIAAVEKELGVSFAKLHLAAHSGGYNGLFKSLSGLRQPKRILMLDNFYFTDPSMAKLIQGKVRDGAACSGFYTSHNEDRWRRGFLGKVECAVAKKDDLGHNGGVNACLGPFLLEGNCP